MNLVSGRRGWPAPGLACLLIGAGLLASVAPSSAKILKTKRIGQVSNELELTVGSGFEYETDPEESEYGFPFLLEYGFTPTLKLSVEPSYVAIRSKPGQRGNTVSGSGDLETTLEYEFIHERRSRPAFTALGVVKWPTAAHEPIGTHEFDYSLGLGASKEFVGFDMDFNAIYTFVGSPPGAQLQNSLELSLASEWHPHYLLDIETEVVTSFGAGGFHGRPGSISGVGSVGPANQGGSETEFTLGLAQHLNDFLKVEEGGVLKNDGTFQAVLAWEWDFAGR